MQNQYDLRWKPIIAKWYHRPFLWPLKARVITEMNVWYTYKVAFGRAFFVKTEYIPPDEPQSRAERRRRMKGNIQIKIHSGTGFDMMTKEQAQALTPIPLTKQKIQEIIDGRRSSVI